MADTCPGEEPTVTESRPSCGVVGQIRTFADPQAVEMAAFAARDMDQFAEHWVRVGADETLVVRTIVADGVVAGNIGSWQESGRHLLGYWVGREWWGRGVATQAPASEGGIGELVLVLDA